jgi:PAS domain S-box-containing protein
MKERFSPLRVAALYAIFGAAWILFSDTALHALVQDAELENRLQTVEGWAVIIVTGGLIYWLASRLTKDLKEQIAESERVKGELLESEKRQLDFLDNTSSIIYMKDVDGRYLFINRMFEELFHISHREIIGKTDHDIFPQTIADAFFANDLKVTEAGTILEFEETAPRDDGENIYISVKFPIRDVAGEIYAVCGISTNITERKRAEEALRESEARFRTLVEYAPEAITMLDVDTGLYLDANPMAEALHGLPRDELIGKVGPADLSPEFQPDGRPSAEAAPDYLGRALAGEFPRFEWMHLTPDRQETLCEVSLARLPDPHRNLVRASIFDITERKAAEAQRAELEAKLAQAQKMEAVGQLTGGVAHDFNNLLAVILGNLELVEDMLAGDDDCRDHIEMAVKATERGADLTQRLLAFSRKQALRPVPVGAKELIEGMLNLLRRSLGETIEIEIVADADLWATEIDPGQLEGALLNLAINARDAMPEGGKLTIETSNLRLTDAYTAAQIDVEPGQYVLVSVSDTGSGMAPDVRKQVFDPFFTTKETGKGTGLGLSMVYGFVKQSGGHIAIYSEVGEGTTIKLYLPRFKGKMAAIERRGQADEPVSGKGEVILVVEDDADLRSMIIDMLRSLDYGVLESGTAMSALDILNETSEVNLLLTDVVLPGGMSGRVLADRALEKDPDLPVLYMSGYTENAIIHHGRIDEGVQLLEKPFRKADLARAIGKALESEPA